MVSLFASSRTPQCMTSLRRVAAHISNNPWFLSGRSQVRGKKKLAKRSPIKVRLLTDISRYGREGSVISIAAGRMRNDFYPRNMAEYMTKDQLRELGIAEDAFLERDSTFGVHTRPQSTKPQEEIADILPVPVELSLLKPERAMEVLAMLIPPNIDFYRTPIPTNPSPPQTHSPSIPATSAISIAAQEAVSQASQKSSIYGSVTTSDIAANIRAVLAEDGEGARVLLSPEDISFAEEQEEKDRVKHLGVFEIVIKVKGAADDMQRTIKINAS